MSLKDRIIKAIAIGPDGISAGRLFMHLPDVWPSQICRMATRMENSGEILLDGRYRPPSSYPTMRPNVDVEPEFMPPVSMARLMAGR
jgi:hypothetical protein